MPNFLIPAASYGLRLRSELPILLTQFADGEYLYSKQIKAIRQVWPHASITYVTGFNCDKVDHLLKKEHVQVIHNLDYESTTICYSLFKALQNIQSSVFLIYGNLFFNNELLTNCLKNVIINAKKSQGIILTSFELDKKNLGIGANGHFDYAFPEKWAKVAYLSGEFFDFLKQEIINNHHCCLHEILNKYTENGFFLNKIDIRTNKLVDIQQIKNVKFINDNYLGKKYGK